MANRDIPRGLYAPQSQQGAVPVTTEYTATNEIFIGDPVTLNASGGATRIANGPIIGGVDAIAITHALTGAKVHVYENLDDLTFEVQIDDNSVTANKTGEIYNLLQAAGNATTLQSGCELDGSTGAAAGATTMITDMISNRPDNDLATANNKVRIKFTEWGRALANT